MRKSFINAVSSLKKEPSELHSGHSGHTTKNRYDDYVKVHMHAMMVASSTESKGQSWLLIIAVLG